METCQPSDPNFEDVTTILSCATQMSNLISAMVGWVGVNSSGADLNVSIVDVEQTVLATVRVGLDCSRVDRRINQAVLLLVLRHRVRFS